jgi:outer membrane protein OmpA-like peptidoglycan-associated protein
MKHLHKFIATALLAGMVPASYASTDTTPYLGLMGSYQFPDQARKLDNGFGATALFGFPVNDYFIPEISLFGIQANRNPGPGREQELGAGLDFNIQPFGRDHLLVPFLLVGGGAQRDEPAGGVHGAGYANAGGGFLINLNHAHTAAFRVEARRIGVFDNQVVAGRSHVLDTRISAGVQIAFNGHGDDLPPPPPAPVLPKDSDGDGVPDNLDRCPGTPHGVQVDASGCPLPPPPPPAQPRDSDGDGVIDSLDRCPDTPKGMRVDAHGCAIKAATVVLHDINFELNKARLTAGARQSLDTVAAGLKGQPTMKLSVAGYTDSTGTAAYNLKLSKERAASARAYLIERGIAASRLQAEGFGETHPVASNKTRAGRAMNRRVEFKVISE